MATTVDIPATVISDAPGAGSYSPNALESAHDATGFSGQIDMAQFFGYSMEYTTIGSYGDGAKKFNWSLPAGASLISMHYVIIAYRQGEFSPTPGGDTTSSAAMAQFGAYPTSLPAVVTRAGGRGDTPYFPDIPVATSWTGVGETLLEETSPDLVLTHDAPFDMFTSVQSDTASAVVKWDYLAIRVIYEEGPVVGVVPPLRLTNRADVFSSAPSLTRSDRSQQGGNRLTGYL